MPRVLQGNKKRYLSNRLVIYRRQFCAWPAQAMWLSPWAQVRLAARPIWLAGVAATSPEAWLSTPSNQDVRVSYEYGRAEPIYSEGIARQLASSGRHEQTHQLACGRCGRPDISTG